MAGVGGIGLRRHQLLRCTGKAFKMYCNIVEVSVRGFDVYGECTHLVCDRSRVTIRLSHPYYAGT